MNEQPQVLDTHFLKNSDFRTVHGSGFYGGFTPSGHLNVIVYTERMPIPKRISFQIDHTTQSIGGEVDREGKIGLVREVQFGVLFDVETAEALVEWLKSELDEYHKIKASSR